MEPPPVGHGVVRGAMPSPGPGVQGSLRPTRVPSLLSARVSGSRSHRKRWGGSVHTRAPSRTVSVARGWGEDRGRGRAPPRLAPLAVPGGVGLRVAAQRTCWRDPSRDRRAWWLSDRVALTGRRGQKGPFTIPGAGNGRSPVLWPRVCARWPRRHGADTPAVCPPRGRGSLGAPCMMAEPRGAQCTHSAC